MVQGGAIGAQREQGVSPRTARDKGSSQMAEEGALALEPPGQSCYLGSAPHRGWGLC